MKIAFEHSFRREMAGFYADAEADTPSAPRLLAFNDALAAQLGLERGDADDTMIAALLSGSALPEGAEPLAFAYAGHQFGQFSPQLGDGRALLLGEIVAPDGNRFDVQLKGSGRTPYSRGGDGKAAIGPVLREYLLSEAMHAMGVPTTRSLAAVATGDPVYRDEALPGAVLTRIASSHIRVGTFEYFASHHGVDHVRRLADYVIARHFPEAAAAPNRYLALFEAVLDRQAVLIAKWSCLGFVHGVMNTDNVSIAGETIDYGPCAFLDAYSPDAVFSSIDRQGRYAYGNQPPIARWNMHRLAEALAGLVQADYDADDVQKMGVLINDFAPRYFAAWTAGMRAKLGLASEADGDFDLATGLFHAMDGQKVDFTLLFRALAKAQAGDAGGDAGPARALFADPAGFDAWLPMWQARLDQDARSSGERAAAMNAVNPLYIPRNHMVEAALDSASRHGSMKPFEALLEVVRNPFNERPGWSAYTRPAPDGFGPYVTYCGT
jgi:serine/tyrosine/threonine adenylyltransferase